MTTRKNTPTTPLLSQYRDCFFCRLETLDARMLPRLSFAPFPDLVNLRATRTRRAFFCCNFSMDDGGGFRGGSGGVESWSAERAPLHGRRQTCAESLKSAPQFTEIARKTRPVGGSRLLHLQIGQALFSCLFALSARTPARLAFNFLGVGRPSTSSVLINCFNEFCTNLVTRGLRHDESSGCSSGATCCYKRDKA